MPDRSLIFALPDKISRFLATEPLLARKRRYFVFEPCVSGVIGAAIDQTPRRAG